MNMSDNERALLAENDRLREALREIGAVDDTLPRDWAPRDWALMFMSAQRIARRALGEPKEGDVSDAASD